MTNRMGKNLVFQGRGYDYLSVGKQYLKAARKFSFPEMISSKCW